MVRRASRAPGKYSLSGAFAPGFQNQSLRLFLGSIARPAPLPGGPRRSTFFSTLNLAPQRALSKATLDLFGRFCGCAKSRAGTLLGCERGSICAKSGISDSVVFRRTVGDLGFRQIGLSGGLIVALTLFTTKISALCLVSRSSLWKRRSAAGHQARPAVIPEINGIWAIFRNFQGGDEAAIPKNCCLCEIRMMLTDRKHFLTMPERGEKENPKTTPTHILPR